MFYFYLECKAKGLNPMGYKIGLELIVRCNCKKVDEVGIVFRDRVFTKFE